MKFQSQRGVALVITLIMLSVITFLTVAFLAVSRRDRASVTTSLNQTDSHLMANAALDRFQAELTSRMIARGTLINYEGMVTRNYINPGGYVDNGNSIDTNNVNYDFKNDGSAFANPDRIRNIANLFFDPRPPVFVKTNAAGSNDFRYYLDYNRNTNFEASIYFETNAANEITTNYTLGEPEWIGVLQKPEEPHSPNNRFIGRYLYISLPIGKTLDLNHIHNYAKGDVGLPTAMPGNGDGFSRNQGFGSWELNFGAFLYDLNTNMYSNPPFYLYSPANPSPNGGVPFQDAVSFLAYRYGGDFNNLSSVANLFPGAGTTAFRTDLIDGYSTAPVLNSPFVNTADPDFSLTRKSWSGANNRRNFYDPQELFDPNKTSTHFVDQLKRVSGNTTNAYDRYTFQRLLEQIGTGSEPEVLGKININYVNNPKLNTVDTNFVEWEPLQFFTNAANALIAQNVINNPNGTFLFNTANQVYTNFAFNNIQIYPTNYYSAQVHRLLQVAANIYDAANTNKFPTIFRPHFSFSGVSNAFITSWTAETNSAFIATALTGTGMQNRYNITNADGLVWGVPLVVGAKKGFPNFNEFTMQTSVQISRNLQIRKENTNQPPPAVILTETNQMLVLGISNTFGLEAWNSYLLAYTNKLLLIATNTFSAALTNQNGTIIWPQNGQPFVTNFSAPPLFSTRWPGTGRSKASLSNSFVMPFGTNFLTFMTNSQYFVGANTFRPLGTNLNFETSVNYDVPTWGLTMTNQLLYILIDVTDTNNQRVVDFVNLDGLNSSIDLSRELLGSDYGSLIAGTTTSPVETVWDTNRVGGSSSPTVPTKGMEAQIRISMGDPDVLDQWTSYSPSSPTGPQKELAIDNFLKFMGLSPIFKTNNTMPPVLLMQTPFNPTRKLDQTASWQVNDPLVHYMTRDLLDSTNSIVNKPRIPPTGSLPTTNLKALNKRYRPWGGNHQPFFNGSESDDNFAYDLRVKDPRVRWSDDWDFPTNKFPNLGWLGRVHRGTPWQTVYFKAAAITNTDWAKWSGHFESHPVNDWKITDLFTTSVNDNAARGLLSVNQTNLAAWSAALSGVVVLSNSLSDAVAKNNQAQPAQFQSFVVQPNSAELTQIVNDINGTRQTNYGGLFKTLGDILSVPSLSVSYTETNGVFAASPFLNMVNSSEQRRYGVTDEAYERIPRQLLSLLKLGQPRFVVYSYGQSLKPAPNSLVLSPPAGSGLFNLCTNYQITGEVVTRTLLRVEANPDVQHPKVVIESYNVLSE